MDKIMEITVSCIHYTNYAGIAVYRNLNFLQPL